MTTRQLSLDLPPRTTFAEGDFLISEANRAAVTMVLDEVWPQGKLVLTGPQGAGKSHLARIWADRAGAVAWQPGAPLPTATAVLVDDADRLPPAAEEPLFHLHNRLAAGAGRLLLTAESPPGRWPLRLPDLASRMQATATVSIGEPDDRLLFAVIAKQFADRQLAPTPDVVPYLVRNIERSFAAAAQVVALIDRLALDAQRPITRHLARLALADLPGASASSDCHGGPP